MSTTPWDVICNGISYFRYLLVVVAFLILLTLISLPAIEVGTPAYYITLANGVILMVGLTIAVSIMYKCGKRES